MDKQNSYHTLTIVLVRSSPMVETDVLLLEDKSKL